MTLQATAWGHDGGTYAGKDMRLHTAAVFGGQTGVVGSGDFLVAAQGSPNATVAVAAGALIVAATGSGLYGDYHVWNDASINSGSFAPTSTNGRKDRLILRVTSGVPALEIVQGTASASPAEPTITGDNYEELALVTLPGSTSAVTNAMITDRRKRAASTGGVIICTSSTHPSSPFEGLTIYETDTDRRYTYDGTNWRLLTPTFTTVKLTSGANSATTTPCTTDAFTSSAANLSLSAVAGDLIEWSYHGSWTNNATVFGFLDIYNTVSGKYWSSNTTTGTTYGLGGANVTGGSTYGVPSSLTAYRVVESGDLSGGTFTCKPRVGANASSRGFGVSSNAPAFFYMRNLGQQV